ncbi:MAG: MFS transporter [Alphaproteobacteria bacterium]|nr:MFS transporter [Alphaproteobacteria bacterium]
MPVPGSSTAAPDPSAPHAEMADRTFRLILYDALASEAMGSLTTGVFLVGYAIELGASNFAIGVLAAVPFLVQLLQLPGVVLVERLRARRAICAWVSAIGRSFLLASATAPWLGPGWGVAALVGLLAVHQGMGAIGGCSWNSWMRDLVPASEFGRFFGRRTAATTALATALAALGGVAIDGWKRALPEHGALGYAALFALSALIGLFGVFLLTITPDRPMAPVVKPLHPLALLGAPFRDGNFRRLIVFLASWNFAVNLAAPFFTVYLLKTLGYAMSTVMALTIVSQLSNLAALGLWGAQIDRFSNKAVLGVSAPLFLVCTLAWTFTGLRWLEPMTLPLLAAIHALMGVATAGVALASSNIAMKLSPAGQATAYLATNSVVTASCAALAPMIGGLGADFFAAHQLTLAFTWSGGGTGPVTLEVLSFHAWTFFFAIACVAGLYSLHRLSLVEEAAGTTDPLVLRHLLLEARRSVHSLSSAAGLLRIARFPLSALRFRSP